MITGKEAWCLSQEAAAVGRVLRAVGGFYRVALDDGSTIDCRLSGRLKAGGARARQGPVLPGDLVALDRSQDTCILLDVMPRVTEMRRPAVANVEFCVVVQSITEPTPNLEMIDRVLVQAASAGLTGVLCISKADLASPEEIQQLIDPYRQAGYGCVVTSAISGEGLAELESILAGRLSTLAGSSGVGKSRLLNSLCPEFGLRVGAISERAARGRHTTRQVQLLPLPRGGWVADTPGFSTVDLDEVELRQLPTVYPDFLPMSLECRFGSCLHRNEPGCAVVSAVEEGRIDAGRYERYLRFVKEIEAREASRY